MKWDNVDEIQSCYSAFENYIKRWLADIHPLTVQVNRLIAEYLTQHAIYYERGVKYAESALGMHMKMFGKDYEKVSWRLLWRDYLLLGNAYAACRNAK